MNTPLIEALRQLNLEPGQAHRVSVNGYAVEIRRVEEEESDFAHMVMLEPWVEFPDPPAVKIVRPTPGPIDLPDPPVIPDDEETT